jgi:hypothetical protein
MDEVATLVAVLENDWGRAVAKPRCEYRQNASVWIGESLTGAVYIPQSQRDGFHAVSRGDRQRELLLHEFRERVDRRDRRPLPLGRGHRRERASRRIERVPAQVLADPRQPNSILNDLAIFRAIEPLAVDAH